MNNRLWMLVVHPLTSRVLIVLRLRGMLLRLQGGGRVRVRERLNQMEKSAVSTIHMQLQVVMPGNNLLGPEMSVLIPQYRGVHILQVSNVHKSKEENLGL